MRWYHFDVHLDDGNVFQDKIIADSEREAETTIRRIYPKARYAVLQSTSFENQANRDMERRRWQQQHGTSATGAAQATTPPPPPPPTPPPPSRAPAGRPWTEVLGLSPSATSGEVRRAYLALIKKYHPDLVASLGPELIELAERKTQELNEAYAAAQAACAQRAPSP